MTTSPSANDVGSNASTNRDFFTNKLIIVWFISDETTEETHG